MEPQVQRRNFNDLIQSAPVVLVDFSAEWCGPCKMMKPILEEVKTTVGEGVKIVKIDVDKNMSTASQYQITGVPTLILFKEGKPVGRQSGVVPPSALKQVIERHR